jgi:hypothetical protein
VIRPAVDRSVNARQLAALTKSASLAVRRGEFTVQWTVRALVNSVVCDREQTA